jgi:hypothetical protein
VVFVKGLLMAKPQLDVSGGKRKSCARNKIADLYTKSDQEPIFGHRIRPMTGPQHTV